MPRRLFMGGGASAHATPLAGLGTHATAGAATPGHASGLKRALGYLAGATPLRGSGIKVRGRFHPGGRFYTLSDAIVGV
jgi:hypothetical protein